MRRIDEVIVHCSATRPEWMANNSTQDKVAEIRRWNVKDRGWRDTGYNFLIDRDGALAGGRDLDDDGDFLEEVGAHTKGYNSHSIGVCLIGGYASSADDEFSDHFTPEQDAALRSFIDDMLRRFGDIRISGHNEHAAKACPGFNVGQWLAQSPPRPPSPIKSPSARPDAKNGGFWAALVAFIASILKGLSK